MHLPFQYSDSGAILHSLNIDKAVHLKQFNPTYMIKLNMLRTHDVKENYPTQLCSGAKHSSLSRPSYDRWINFLMMIGMLPGKIDRLTVHEHLAWLGWMPLAVLKTRTNLKVHD